MSLRFCLASADVSLLRSPADTPVHSTQSLVETANAGWDRIHSPLPDERMSPMLAVLRPNRHWAKRTRVVKLKTVSHSDVTHV